MNNLDNERDMWAAINETIKAAESTKGLIVTQTAHTKRGERVVILTDRMVTATMDDGRIATTEGDVVTWYTLGKPFRRGGAQVRYGYLRFDADVSAERARRRSQQDWNNSHR